MRKLNESNRARIAREPQTIETLERRLDEGYRRIEEAIDRGEDVQAWESFWIDLLHQYEAEWDSLPKAE